MSPHPASGKTHSEKIWDKSKVKNNSEARDVTHLPDEDHHSLLQTDQFLRNPLGFVEQHIWSVVVLVQCGLQVDQRRNPRLDQHQN